MLDFNEELAKFQPCADLEEAEENIYGKELEEIKKNKTELYKANQMIKKYNHTTNHRIRTGIALSLYSKL